MKPLPAAPRVSRAWRGALDRLRERTERDPPRELAAAVRDELGVDLAARYAGLSIPHPFGKGSGQLSCTAAQVEADVAAGVAFIVLKTVIAEGPEGDRTMEAWAVLERKMRVGRRRSPEGRDGWTVTWKGRGWTGSLEEYLAFVERALDAARASDVPVIPSVKYHLPGPGESPRQDEYRLTTERLLALWERSGCGGAMIVEKDFSPTLAGDARAADRDRVLQWLVTAPRMIRAAAGGRVCLGVKVMNALFDDRFQADMVRTLAEEDVAAFLVVFNRLFDPAAGVAYGGWELSDRNLRVLDALHDRLPTVPPLSATGNVCSGRVMLEYARRGCENGQLHTYFQLPLSEYTARGGSRSARALHTLLLHPTEGLAIWLRHLHEAGELDVRDGVVRFLDVVDAARAAPRGAAGTG